MTKEKLSTVGEGVSQDEVAQAVESGRSIADAFDVSMFTLGLLVVIAGLLVYIFRDRLFISRWEGF